jgi:hypothetical protein
VNDEELGNCSNLEAGKSQAREGKEAQDIYEQKVCDGGASDSSICFAEPGYTDVWGRTAVLRRHQSLTRLCPFHVVSQVTRDNAGWAGITPFAGDSSQGQVTIL